MASLGREQVSVVGPAGGLRRHRRGAARRLLLLLRDAAAAGPDGARRSSTPIQAPQCQGAGNGPPAAGVPGPGRRSRSRGSRASSRSCPKRRTWATCCAAFRRWPSQSNLTIRGFRPQPIATEGDCMPSGRLGWSSKGRITTSARSSIGSAGSRGSSTWARMAISAKDTRRRGQHPGRPAPRRCSSSSFSRSRHVRTDRKERRQQAAPAQKTE